MTPRTFFNAHHSPIGAFASFTFGAKGPRGGLGLELGGPADESLYIGVEDRDAPGRYHALPFFGGRVEAEGDYDVEGLSDLRHAATVGVFPDAAIERRLGAAVDEWRAGDLTFRVFSPVREVPDPETAPDEALRAALVPAVMAELTLDNRQGKRPRKAFFGYAGSDRAYGMRVCEEGNLVGVGQGGRTLVATDEAGVLAGVAWQPEAILNARHEENLRFLLGSLGLLVGTVPPGEIRTFRFAIAFFREDTVTTGVPTRYLYRRWFDRIEDVARYALEEADRTVEDAVEGDERLLGELTPERSLMLAHAVRSYYGSTQCLEWPDGRPFWVVNEGEYRMMNTFDLTIDQAFFELALNPWTVRNELDFFVDRYAYEDKVRFPGEAALHPGGIAFTHDMGIANALSEPGRSGYEQAGLRGCFSYMSSEELVNWVLCACVYAEHTGDWAWVERRRETFLATLTSLVNRDHPDPRQRNGVMGLDGSRCQGGKEITTYDSLDASLGQARNNLYLAVKSWAAYVLLEPVLRRLGEGARADDAGDQAARCASTIVAAADGDGFLPAVMGEGVVARIIPAIEGLIYPFVVGRHDALHPDGRYGDLRRTLERHFDGVLTPGICRFPDGGWRLSSTSRNSWLSKIYLCQAVSELIFDRAPDAPADAAHLAWLMDEENGYYAWSDQMLEGKAVGSRYYPRGVTAILWTAGPRDVLGKVRSRLIASPSPV